MRCRCKIYTYTTSLERDIENIFYGAMFVFLANLGFMRISMVGVYGMRVGVQFQEKRIGHHCSGKEQEQHNGDITG